MPQATLAPVLVRARAAISAKWPARDRRSDGWIGDRRHQLRRSDHNPDEDGMVHAIDIDVDGIHVPTVLAAFLLRPSTNYVIFKRRIFDTDVENCAPRTYLGQSPHDEHIHVSIKHGRVYEGASSPWSFLEREPRWVKAARKGSAGTEVLYTQAFLLGHGYCVHLDGHFGTHTQQALRSFQKAHKLLPDGICGPRTRKALKTA